jgi:hypothetical protein
VTDAQILRAVEAHRKAQARADELLAIRDDVIAKHLGKPRYTHASLALLTGLSNGSINRIAQKTRKR